MSLIVIRCTECRECPWGFSAFFAFARVGSMPRASDAQRIGGTAYRAYSISDARPMHIGRKATYAKRRSARHSELPRKPAAVSFRFRDRQRSKRAVRIRVQMELEIVHIVVQMIEVAFAGQLVKPGR